MNLILATCVVMAVLICSSMAMPEPDANPEAWRGYLGYGYGRGRYGYGYRLPYGYGRHYSIGYGYGRPYSYGYGGIYG